MSESSLVARAGRPKLETGDRKESTPSRVLEGDEGVEGSEGATEASIEFDSSRGLGVEEEFEDEETKKIKECTSSWGVLGGEAGREDKAELGKGGEKDWFVGKEKSKGRRGDFVRSFGGVVWMVKEPEKLLMIS